MKIIVCLLLVIILNSCSNNYFDKDVILPISKSKNLVLMYKFSRGGWDSEDFRIYKVNENISLDSLQNYPKKDNTKEECNLVKWHKFTDNKEKEIFLNLYYSESQYADETFNKYLIYLISIIKYTNNYFISYCKENTSSNSTQLIYLPNERLVFCIDVFLVGFYNEIEQKRKVDSLINYKYFNK